MRTATLSTTQATTAAHRFRNSDHATRTVTSRPSSWAAHAATTAALHSPENRNATVAAAVSLTELCDVSSTEKVASVHAPMPPTRTLPTSPFSSASPHSVGSPVTRLRVCATTFLPSSSRLETGGTVSSCAPEVIDTLTVSGRCR
jgi:hypothetical protein